jgi:hypothetical protein
MANPVDLALTGAIASDGVPQGFATPQQGQQGVPPTSDHNIFQMPGQAAQLQALQQQQSETGDGDKDVDFSWLQEGETKKTDNKEDSLKALLKEVLGEDGEETKTKKKSTPKPSTNVQFKVDSDSILADLNEKINLALDSKKYAEVFDETIKEGSLTLPSISLSDEQQEALDEGEWNKVLPALMSQVQTQAIRTATLFAMDSIKNALPALFEGYTNAYTGQLSSSMTTTTALKELESSTEDPTEKLLFSTLVEKFTKANPDASPDKITHEVSKLIKSLKTKNKKEDKQKPSEFDFSQMPLI